MVAKRTSDDWPALTLWTLRFNALLSRQQIARRCTDPKFKCSLFACCGLCDLCHVSQKFRELKDKSWYFFWLIDVCHEV
ncbi:hypothetical protein MFFC18_21130 [Mariniblastus fucicola]|uniref:Uncharacterized protein n=1 Tax=Mariniblastus fucicola TaxID=980251 RepID=A0A5B9P6L4_9BACT|nr:hypothetical protein MFFC18_21130 [Mariniblastus fucicola]